MQPMIKLIENYSERGIAVVGETYNFRKELKELNGSFNPRLKYEGLTVAGWVFSKKKIEAIRLLVAKHSNPEPVPVPPVTIAPIIERDEKPSKQVKQPTKVENTAFRMLVKCTGFVELEREFTSEQVMNKFLNDLRKQREKEVDSKMGILKKGSNRLTFYNQYGTSEDRQTKYNKAVEDLKREYKKNGVEPLKIQFTNLINQ